MAVPKRKTSKARRDKRRNNLWKLSAPALAKCPQCGDALLIKKRKKMLYCRNEKCGYTREDTKSKE